MGRRPAFLLTPESHLRRTTAGICEVNPAVSCDKSNFVAVILLRKKLITHPLERGGATWWVKTPRSRENWLLH